MISAVLALVSIGLFASLLPQTSFVLRSSGEVVDAAGPVWPEHAIEQALDTAPEVVSEIRIWAAAGIDGGEAPIVASLRRPMSEKPVRQVRVRIRASHLLAPYVLVFPPYKPAPGEKLVLQIWVSDERDNHVLFGASEPGRTTSLTMNRQPTDRGPLAYELIWKGTGWRAALKGSTPDLARLAGAMAAGALAAAITVLSHPFVSGRLRNMTRRMRTAIPPPARRIKAGLRLFQGDHGTQASPVKTSAARRAFYVFPWLIPAFAILHYLSNNLLLFRLSESIAVFAVTMAAVTIAFAALRLILKSAAIAAVLTGLLGTAFFSYGHVYLALGDHADHRYLLGLGIPIVLGLGAFIRRSPNLARKTRLTLNLGSVLLVLLPAYQIAADLYGGGQLQTFDASDGFPGLDERLDEARDRLSRDQLRDIYYIVPDRYPRSGSPPDFDNSEFVQELQRRGFYVASQARSNYGKTLQSLPSSLNMRYVNESLGQLHPHDIQIRHSRQLHAATYDHTLGRVVKALGYQYVHVLSGWPRGSRATDTPRKADLTVDFGPSGTLFSRADELSRFDNAARVSNEFTTALLQTTAARPFLSQQIQVNTGGRYNWTDPARALAWLEFMKSAGTMGKPKFVFAHIIKPHAPHSFDRYGNVTFHLAGWPDDHDPTVSNAYYGQIIWLNGQMLEVIDAILDDYDEPPIIVIAADHGDDRHNPAIANDILAAFLLPDGGESALYPSITSVNHFRAILDYYFGLDLGLLEDRVYHPDI